MGINFYLRIAETSHIIPRKFSQVDPGRVVQNLQIIHITVDFCPAQCGHCPEVLGVAVLIYILILCRRTAHQTLDLIGNLPPYL